ncbi:MAG: DUF2934 domain-containing protein [Pirellulales bacterium]|nr:DUF2934 domain-containing protein [Pirellulales bacterium]
MKKAAAKKTTKKAPAKKPATKKKAAGTPKKKPTTKKKPATKKPATSKSASSSNNHAPKSPPSLPTDKTRDEWIAEVAYFRWQDAGCPHGDGSNFWVEAEAEYQAKFGS